MILEVAVLDIRPGSEPAFEAAFAQARPLIAGMQNNSSPSSSGFLPIKVCIASCAPCERYRLQATALKSGEPCAASLWFCAMQLRSSVLYLPNAMSSTLLRPVWLHTLH